MAGRANRLGRVITLLRGKRCFIPARALSLETPEREETLEGKQEYSQSEEWGLLWDLGRGRWLSFSKTSSHPPAAHPAQDWYRPEAQPLPCTSLRLRSRDGHHLQGWPQEMCVGVSRPASPPPLCAPWFLPSPLPTPLPPPPVPPSSPAGSQPVPLPHSRSGRCCLAGPPGLSRAPCGVAAAPRLLRRRPRAGTPGRGIKRAGAGA